MNIDTLIFDLDGTLVHTAPDLLRAVNHILAAAARPPVALDQLIDQVSFGAREMIRRGFELTGAPVDDTRLDAMFASFIDYYSANIAIDSKPFAGCIDLLESCRSRGMKLAVCTNKLEGMSVKLLRQLNMLKYFGAVVGQDTIAIAKPDPAPLLEAINRIGGSPETALMVGDSKTDILTAKAAKIPVAAFTFGYSDEPIETLGADFVLSDYAGLSAVLDHKEQP